MYEENKVYRLGCCPLVAPTSPRMFRGSPGTAFSTRVYISIISAKMLEIHPLEKQPQKPAQIAPILKTIFRHGPFKGPAWSSQGTVTVKIFGNNFSPSELYMETIAFAKW